MQKNDVHVWASRAVCAAAAVAVLYWLGRQGVELLLPFLLAVGVAMLVHPLGRGLGKRTGISPRLCNVLVLFVLGGALGGLGYLAVYYFLRQAAELYAWLQSNADSLASALGGLLGGEDGGISLPIFIEKLFRLPLIAELFGGLDAMLRSLAEALLSGLGKDLTNAALDIAAAVPSAFLSLLVFLLSCFYLCLDGERIFAWAMGCFPSGVRPRVKRTCEALTKGLRAYLRAYLLIFLLTLAELWIGLCIVRVRYAFLLAVVISLLDLLPVIGSGLVLAPWGIFCLLSGNVRLGAGLLVLWGVVTLVRQIAEPKIVGNSLGLHPLLALAAMYVGFRLFGAVGLIFGPCAAIAIKVILQQGSSDIARGE